MDYVIHQMTKLYVQNFGLVPVPKDSIDENKNINKKELYALFLTLFKFGIYIPIDKLEIILKSKYYDIIIDGILTLVGGTGKWDNVLLGYEKVLKDEEEARFLTFIHYLTTYGKKLIEMFTGQKVDISTFYPKERKDISEFQKTLQEVLSIDKDEKVDIKDIENKTFMILDVEINDIKTFVFKLLDKILYKHLPLTELENKFLESVFSKFSFIKDYKIDFNKIKFKEIKATLIFYLIKYEHYEFNVEGVNAEDVFRAIVKYHIDEPLLLYTKQLRESVRKSSFDEYNDDYIKVMWKLLDNCDEEEIIRLYKQKRKLINLLTASMNIKKYVNKFKSARLLKKLKNRHGKIYKNIKTKYQEFEESFKNYKDLEKTLLKYPEIFVERFTDLIINYTNYMKNIPTITLVKLINRLPTKTLFRLLNIINILKNIDKLEEFMNFQFDDSIHRIFRLPHNYYIDVSGEKRYRVDEIKNNSSIRNLIIFINSLIEDVLKQRLKNITFYIDTNVYDKLFLNMKLPLTVRYSGEGLYFEPGTSYDISEFTKAIRFGIWWVHNKEDFVDLDLSCALINRQENKRSIIGWNGNYIKYDNNKNVIAIFSGDVTRAPEPEGGAEFIDINIQNEYLNENFDYAICAIYNYSAGIPSKTFVGVMELDDEDDIIKNEIKDDKVIKYFNPSKLTFYQNITYKTGLEKYIVGIIDFKEKKYYPLQIKMSGVSRMLSQDIVFMKYLYDYVKVSEYKLSVYDLLEKFVNVKFVDSSDKNQKDLDIINDNYKLFNKVVEVLTK